MENLKNPSKTDDQFEEVRKICSKVFSEKIENYLSSWAILKTPVITKQIHKRLMMIREIEERKEQTISDSIKNGYIEILNHSAAALICIEINKPDFDVSSLPSDKNLFMEKIKELYEKHVKASKDLLDNKNHDYGEAWRIMRVTSLTDLMLMKTLRLRQIENNNGQTLISEGPEANYHDIINYAAFALIRLSELEK